MTDKEQVLAIYPNARALSYTFGGQRLWFIINDSILLKENQKELATDYTIDRAWSKAWNNIQQEMLEKLKS